MRTIKSTIIPKAGKRKLPIPSSKDERRSIKLSTKPESLLIELLTKFPGARIRRALPIREEMHPRVIHQGTFLYFFFFMQAIITKMVRIKQAGPMLSLLQPVIRPKGILQ